MRAGALAAGLLAAAALLLPGPAALTDGVAELAKIIAANA